MNLFRRKTVAEVMTMAEWKSPSEDPIGVIERPIPPRRQKHKGSDANIAEDYMTGLSQQQNRERSNGV